MSLVMQKRLFDFFMQEKTLHVEVKKGKYSWLEPPQWQAKFLSFGLFQQAQREK